MTSQRQAIGAYGERLASRHLQAKGLVVLDRNWRCELGEVDLVLRDGNAVVFCEVKTRRSDAFGTPAEAVVPAKAERIRRIAARWLAEHSVRPRVIRFDVVAVLPQVRGAAVVEHLPGAF
jgi:putative endonuclease